MTTPMDIKKLLGARMTGPGGEELGTVEQVFFDDVTGNQEWARLRMGGMLGGKDRFVPLIGSSLSGRDVVVPFDKNKVKDSPELAVDRHITPEQESRLRAYYGLEAARGTTTTTTTSSGKATTAAAAGAAGAAGITGETRRERTISDTGVTPGAGQGGRGEAGLVRESAQLSTHRAEDLSLTRSEERIHFRTEQIETGRVRLHKYVDVVPVEERVRLVHEEFELERLPVTEAATPTGEIGEDTVEVVLRGQRAFAVKEAHAVERVRLNIKQVPEERVMRDEIRRERIEVERFEDGVGRRVGGTGPESASETTRDDALGRGLGKNRPGR